MGEVVERTNRAQFEVVELQSARYVFIFSLPLFSLDCDYSKTYADDGLQRRRNAPDSQTADCYQ